MGCWGFMAATSWEKKNQKTFQSPVPSLLSAFSCIVCLHQTSPQKPSLTLQRLEFGLIYRHQSLFVWMSYGLTLLVCSFVVITKTHTVTAKLPLNCHTTTILFHKDFQEEALDTANTPVFRQPHIPPHCKPANPSGAPGTSTESNKKAWIQTRASDWRIWNMYFPLLLMVCILLWKNTSENTHFLFLWGSAGAGKRGKKLVMLWFLGKIPIFFNVFRNRAHAPSDNSHPERLRWFDFAPCRSKNFLCSFYVMRKCAVDSQAVTYSKLSVKWPNLENYEDQCIMK